MLKKYTCHGVADKRSRKELKGRQKSYEPCLEIYRITAKFPNEESEPGTLDKDITKIERMLKALIKSLENKHLNP